MRWFTLASVVLLTGCMQALEEQTKKSDSNVINKKTQDVGEFDPKAGAKLSDSKVRIDDPVLGGLQAYRPMVEQIMKSHVKHAVDLFHASEDRYPATYEEFMTRIIKENNIQLPVLPGKYKYQYDVANHELVVVEPEPDAASSSATPN